MKLKEIAIGYIDIPLVTPFKTALRTVNSVNDLIALWNPRKRPIS